MSVQAFHDASERFLNACVAKFNQARGSAPYRGLFIDNHDGQFSFSDEPMVIPMAVADSAASLTATRAVVEAQATPGIVFNMIDRTGEQWTGTVWEAPTSALWYTHIKNGRMYFNPTTARLIYIDLSGVGRRLTCFVAPPEPPPPIGDVTLGYYGEIASADFITGPNLASAMSFANGTAMNNTEGWLKFSLDDTILYVAKKPFRQGISWNNLNAANLVTGNRTILIGGKTYKVRLIKGVNGSVNAVNGYDHASTHGSEWNRLMYHVHDGAHSNVSNTLASEGITVGDFDDFGDYDLTVYGSGGQATYTWTQDTPANSATAGFVRGFQGVSYLNYSPKTSGSNDYGWRPVLELVP